MRTAFIRLSLGVAWVCLIAACGKQGANPSPNNFLTIAPSSTYTFSPSTESFQIGNPGYQLAITGTDSASNDVQIYITCNFSPSLNASYSLVANSGGNGASVTDSLGNWVEVVQYPQMISSATITYTSLPLGSLPFTLSFRIGYANGLHMEGSVSATTYAPTPCSGDNVCVAKPVIYLYPRHTQDVVVSLKYQGMLTATYPDYDPGIKGWRVKAKPDGSLINSRDHQEYSYLFWEGVPNRDISEEDGTGFVVPAKDTKRFLREKLSALGLTPREYNEFIVYWFPRMQKNAYNFVRFAGKTYTSSAPLEISPRPDSLLRVFMTYRALQNPKSIDAKPQKLPHFRRKGFTVIEWGGTELPNIP